MNEVNALDKEIQATTTRLINARCRRPLFGIESVKVTSSADSDDAARLFRYDRARCSGMIPPT